MEIRTLAQRDAERVAAKQAAIAVLETELAAYARAHGGRFLLFGSAARNELRYDSDVDLLIDFGSDPAIRAAWDVLESACSRLRLECDARPITWCSQAFLNHVLPEARAIG